MSEHSDLQVAVGSQSKGSGCPTTLIRRFACDLSSIGEARRAVDELSPWLEPALLADLRLLVSELVSNSVEHGSRRDGRTIGLQVSISNERVRAEVEDGGRGFTPLASLPSVDTASGRGLYLIDQLATSWGATSGDGTRVWFELVRERLEATDDDSERLRDVPAVRTAA